VHLCWIPHGLVPVASRDIDFTARDPFIRPRAAPGMTRTLPREGSPG